MACSRKRGNTHILPFYVLETKPPDPEPDPEPKPVPSTDYGCTTTGGNMVQEKCIFPFTYYGQTCAGPKCCDFDNKATETGGWCSTRVKDGEHISTYYGYCNNTPCQIGTCIGVYFCSSRIILSDPLKNLALLFYFYLYVEGN